MAFGLPGRHVLRSNGRRALRRDVLRPQRPALEFAIGTGRIALPLAATGLRVDGIELSPAMIEQLRTKPGADRL